MLAQRIEDSILDDLPDECRIAHNRAMQENGALMVRWAPETRNMFVMEFISHERLYPKLNEFLRKRIR